MHKAKHYLIANNETKNLRRGDCVVRINTSGLLVVHNAPVDGIDAILYIWSSCHV